MPQEYADLIRADIDDALKAFGADDARRADACLVLAPRCEHRNGLTILKDIGAAIDTPQAREWLAANKPHLLPPEISADLREQALTNATARGRMVREYGEAETLAYLQSRGMKGLGDFKSKPTPADASPDKPRKPDAGNPWSRESWSITGQGKIFRALGEAKARAMCKAAGCAWGATRPAA